MFSNMLREFKEFAMKGNVVDMAVGIIIGAAFGKIVSSLVNDVFMPIVGMLLRGVDFSTLSLTIGSANVRYGSFIQNIVDFVIVAFVIFMMVKQMNRFKKPAPAPAAPSVTPTELLLTDIRDLLRKP